MLLPTAAALLLAQTELIDSAPDGHVNRITSQVFPLAQTLAEWWGDPEEGDSDEAGLQGAPPASEPGVRGLHT